MQTIPKFSTRPNGDSHTVLWGDQVVGSVAFNIELMRWEYSRYSQYPAVSSGDTAEDCLAAAQSDHAAQYAEPTVTHIADDIKPAYVHRRTSWKTAGSGYEQTVTVRQGQDTYRVLTPVGFAQRLRVGSVVELYQDRLDGLCLRWSAKPIRRRVEIAV